MAEFVFDRSDDKLYGDIGNIVTGLLTPMHPHQLFEPIAEGIIPLVYNESGSHTNADRGILPIALIMATGYVTLGSPVNMGHTHFDIMLIGRTEGFVGISRRVFIEEDGNRYPPEDSEWAEIVAPLRPFSGQNIEMVRGPKSVTIRTI
jgi:hypothetical protein